MRFTSVCFTLVLIFSFLLAGFISAQQPVSRITASSLTTPAPQPTPFSRDLLFADWNSGAKGFDKAAQAAKSGRGAAIVYFYAPWCGYCRRIERDLFTAAEVQQYFQNVSRVQVFPDAGEKEKSLADKYLVSSYPALFILPSGSDKPKQITAFVKTEQGWKLRSPAEFVKLCEEAAKN